MRALLQKLGISPDSELDEILEKLKEFNTEYLERIENCKDSDRLSELRELQDEIERAIYDLSSNIIQPGDTTKTIQNTSPQKAPEPSVNPVTRHSPETPAAPTRQVQYAVPGSKVYADAAAAFRRNDYRTAIEKLLPYAKQKELSALMLCGNAYEMLRDSKSAKKMYFYAAETGDKTAAMKLARMYSEEKNYDAALDWGRKAYDPANADSAAILANIYANLKNYAGAYRCFRDCMYACKGYERHKAEEKADFYLKLLIDNTNNTRRKNNYLKQLIQESKDDTEKQKLREAISKQKERAPKKSVSDIFSSVFEVIKILPALAGTAFILFLAGTLVYHIIIGWAHPYKTEGGYSVSISKKSVVKIPSSVFFSPVVTASLSDAKCIYVPESLEKLSVVNEGYDIDYLGAVGDTAKTGGVRIPETLKELSVKFSRTIGGKYEQRSLLFSFSQAKALEELRGTHIRMNGGLDLSAAPNLASVRLSHVRVDGALTPPVAANVYLSVDDDSHVDKLLIPENAEISDIYIQGSSTLGNAEFPDTAHIGKLSLLLTGNEAFIVPDKVSIDELRLFSCNNVPLMEIGKGVKSAWIHKNDALETLIVNGAQTELSILDNPKLVRLEILSECSSISLNNNAVLEEITLRTYDPGKLDIDDTIRLLRVPADAVEAYRTHFADVYPDMQIAAIDD